jgi:hypothetical protein
VADYLPPIVAKLEGDHSSLVTALRESKEKVKTWATEVGKTKATLEVDTTLKDGTLAALREKIKDSKAAKFDVVLRLKTGTLADLRTKVKESSAAKLEVATTLKAGALADLRQEIKDSSAAKLDTALRLKDGTLAALKEKVKDSPAAKLSVQLKLDSVQADTVRADLEANAVEVKIKPKMDQVAQRRVATVLMELGKRIDVWIRPTTHQSSQVATEARLAHLARDRTATIRTVVIGGGGGSGGVGGGATLGTLLSLAPALAPVAAVLTQTALHLAASLGSAAVAVGAFGLAVVPQIKQLGDAADAQTKYTEAVTKYGPASKQAAQAQDQALQSLTALPPATRRAAVGYMELRTSFKSWSDDLARFTMAPVEKSIAVVEAILPKLNPLVKGTSTELDRLITVAGGAVSTPGFDAMMKRFTTFADGALKRGVDDVIHFSRVLSEGKANGPVADFMKYAEHQGPAVRKTLENIARAVMQVFKGAAEAGPGVLSLVNATAALVASLPVSFIARTLQAYTALKLIKLTSAGITTVAGSITALSTRLTALRVASTTAGGGVAGVRAAIGSLSTGAKIGGAVAAIGALVLVVNSLMSSGKKAPDVDKLTTSLGELGHTGKVSGEAAVAFGGDFDKLNSAIDRLNGGGSKMDHFNDTMNSIFTLGHKKSNSWNDAKKDIDAVDDALAQLVQGGKADLAAAAVSKLSAEVKKSGQPTKELTDRLDGYKSALADAKFEQDLVADSMGMFGQQAQSVQRDLDAQKQSADGLRQSIQALNDVNRAGLSAEADFQQAIDDTTAAIKGHHSALKMVHGQIDLNSQAARDAYKPLADLAAAADADAAAARDQGKSWSTVSGIYEQGRAKLISAADAMGLTRDQAKKLSDQILKAPDKTAFLKGDLSDLQAKLKKAKADLGNTPASKQTSIRGDIVDLQNKIAAAKRAIASVSGKTVHVNVVYKGIASGSGVAVPGGGRYATGAVVSGGVRRMAEGGFGRPAMMAKGGSNILWGEGPDESYIPHTRNARSRQIATETVGILGGSVSWGQAAVGAGSNVAAGVARGIAGGQPDVMAAAIAMAKAATAAFSDELGIASPSKKFKALGAYVMTGLVQGLTGSTASVKAATKRIASMLYTDFGSSHKGLQKAVAKDNAALLKLAADRDSVAGKLKAAQSKLAALLKSWASERDSIASGIMQNASIITTAPQAGFALTSQDVVNNMRDQAAKASQFAAQLRALQKAGLRSDLIAQIAASGVDQGGATTAALMGASKGTITELNNLQKGMQSSANATGSAVADAMYGAGIKSAQGLVQGLQSQEKAIEAQMLKIAKSMQAAIKKALGIRSPSAVMAQLGDYTAQGMAVGINRSTKHAVVAAQGMAMAVQQGAALAGGGMAGGPTVVHNHYTVQGSVVSERTLVDIVEQGYLNRARRNSTTYPAYKR